MAPFYGRKKDGRNYSGKHQDRPNLRIAREDNDQYEVEDESGSDEERGLDVKDTDKKYTGKMEFPKGYASMAHKLLRNFPKEQRKAVVSVLRSENAVKSYEILEENDFDEAETRDVMVHGMQDLARGNKISVGNYAMAIATRLKKVEQYGEIVDDMYKDGIINLRQYHDLKDNVDDKLESGHKKFNSGLEHLVAHKQRRIAAVWIFIGLGAILMLLSATSVTGAVIGPSALHSPATFVVGLVLFVLGLLVGKKS